MTTTKYNLNQIYCKNISDNIGARLAADKNGIFYTKNKNNGTYTEGDEVMTKAAVNDLLSAALERISALESEVAALKAAGPVLAE